MLGRIFDGRQHYWLSALLKYAERNVIRWRDKKSENESALL